jgi:hypothetical protein
MMSDFEIEEAMPQKVFETLKNHPGLKDRFKGRNFLGKYLYYEDVREAGGDVWHLVILETDDAITQIGIDDVPPSGDPVLFFQSVSISDLRLYCELSEDFKVSLVQLAQQIEDQDIHFHFHPHGHGGHGRHHHF